MQIKSIAPRSDWEGRVQELGLTYLDNDGTPYWTEDRYVEFTQRQIDDIEATTLALHHLCLNAIDEIIARGWLRRMRVPDALQPLIIASWERGDPYIFGRFDLAYDGINPPKLIEYNADTPAGTIEGAVIQWDWVEQNRARGLLPADADHFNGIDEAMINAWRRAIPKLRSAEPVWFTTKAGDNEAEQNLHYMVEMAQQAGLKTNICDIRAVGYDHRMKWFCDPAGMPIRTMFKLYEWEAMARDEFAGFLAGTDTTFLEPMWKMLLSNKALLPVLWELYPDHPNLLPAYFDEAPLAGAPRVRKPIFSMEGANIQIFLPGEDGEIVAESGGDYGEEGHIWQAYAELPSFDGQHMVVGSWVSGANPRYEGLATHPRGGDPCGITIRTHPGLITGYFSRVMPHVFMPDPADEPARIPDEIYVP